MTMTLGRKVLLVAALAFLPVTAACDQVETPEPAAPLVEAAPVAAAPVAPVAVPETDPVKATEKRVADLVALKAALDAYHAETGKYPAAYDGLKSFVDRGPAWIAELSPKYIAALPRDPALSDSVEGPQYLYASDTIDYKLIAHGVGGACGPEVERDGIKIDRNRQNADAGCWAYGFWSAGFDKF